MASNKYIASVGDLLRGPVKRQMPDRNDYYQTDGAGVKNFNSNKFNTALKEYYEHLASLPIAFTNVSWLGEGDNGKILEEGKDFTSRKFCEHDLSKCWCCSHPPYKMDDSCEYWEYIAVPIKDKQPERKPDCSNHPKELFGQTDMKVVAEAIGNLHYETLSTMLYHLSNKLFADGQKDFNAGRTKLSHFLFEAQMKTHRAHQMIDQAYKQCKPFMNDKTPQP